jgi:hypothetical protein
VTRPAPRRALAGLAVALVLAGAPPGPAPAGAQAPRAERPTYEVGERWVRSDGAYDLVRIEGDLYVFAAGPAREVRLTRDLGLARVRRADRALEFEPALPLAWPLEVGKAGAGETTVRLPGAPVSVPLRVAWRVETWEEVTVPAGTFKAFRVVYALEPAPPGQRGAPPGQRGAPPGLRRGDAGREGEGEARRRALEALRGRGPRQVTLWYAPEVQEIVKADGGEAAILSFQVVAVERPVRPPLTVVLRELPDYARFATDRLTLAGRVTSGKGVARVVVTLNGREVSRREEAGTPTRDVELSVPLRLEPGRNVLIVTAADAAGETRQVARVLFHERPPAAAAEPAETAPSIAALRRLQDRAARAPVVIAPAPEGRMVPPPAAEPPAPAPPPAPLKILLSAPAPQARVEQETLGLAGIVSSGTGVRHVVVALNGAEVARLSEPAPPRALVLNVPVRLQEGSNTLVVTATDVDGAVEQEVRAVQYDRTIPLTIAIRYPPDGTRVGDPSSALAAVVTSTKGVAKVRVTLNGAEVAAQAERAPQRSLAVSQPLTLREGANVIALEAEEAGGTVRQEVRTIFYDRPSPIAAATPGAPPAPPPPPAAHERWAVVIGVGAYDSPQIPRLKYTVSDAEAIYRTLIGPAGFKKDNVLLLSDTAERKPTLRNIKWALGTFLARSAAREDTVVIFFAGHGAPEVDQRGLERDGLAKYLIPLDADADDLYSTALPMDELQTIFGRIEAERVVAFVDACYSGAAGGRTFLSKRTRAGTLDDQFLERLTRSKGRAIITASRPSEVSIELPELGHGIFTYYLVEGLKGAADTNRDSIVTLQELYEYVEQQVSKKSRAVGGNQHPVMKGELEGVLPLAKVGGR